MIFTLQYLASDEPREKLISREKLIFQIVMISKGRGNVKRRQEQRR